MHADISRRTFDAADGYRSVVLQQGRVLLDADWNEQAEITTHHDETRMLDLVGRSAGPAPSGEATGVAALGPFAVVGPDGTVPDDETAPVAWVDLRVTPGRYYLDGVLAESSGPEVAGGAPDARGWQLTDQPYLATIGEGGSASPGLAEPSGAADGDRYALQLDVWTHHVTADEDPALLEPALGGPDTTTRARTVWQVRLDDLVAAKTEWQCSDLQGASASAGRPRRMVASLVDLGASTDPCLISASGGYRRLENQLYRVQIHTGGADPTFVWSRDNGAVVAGLAALEPQTGGATLTLDRLGRDEELSFAAGQLVEVTSSDLQLRGVPGFLATAGTPVLVTDVGGSSSTLDLPVTWLDDAPPSRDALGRVPIVRRWEGGPATLTPDGGAAGDPVPLEDGIQVAFPAGGRADPGDFWLIPARTVRLAYGLTQLSGTIEWPPGGKGPAEQPPVGPIHHRAPIAIVRRVGAADDAGGGWVVESDCRLLFPAATELTTLDLLGGDGQLAPPGSALPQPVRVAVRAGSRPVPGAALGLDAGAGTVTGAPVTGPDGVAAFTWTLAASGPPSQTLRIWRLDDHGDQVDAAVVVTGRLCLAQLRLLGGDGQEVDEAGRVVPQPVRVVLDGVCGPRAKVEVAATASGTATSVGRVAEAVPGKPTPDSLGAAPSTVSVLTDGDGVASFWWQPGFALDQSATLEIVVAKSDQPPVRVSAQLDRGGSTVPGVHVEKAIFRTGRPFLNDALVASRDLASGIVLGLDAPVVPASVTGRPVVRVVLELPWPLGADGLSWVGGQGTAGEVVGFRDVQLAAQLDCDGKSITWAPTPAVVKWTQDMLWDVLAQHGWDFPLVGRFVVDGWAVVGAEGEARHLNGHASTVMVQGRTDVVLPTNDAVPGGQFQQWFRLVRGGLGDRQIEVPDIANRTQAVAVRMVEEAGLRIAEVREETDSLVRAKLAIRTDPKAGTPVEVGTGVVLVMSLGRG